MALFLVKLARKVLRPQQGEFVVEADDMAGAEKEAASWVKSKTADIAWTEDGPIEISRRHPPTIEEIEVLADGTEDIRERFD